MALDIQGFITPEQTFKGLSDLGSTMQAQKAAKAKAEEEGKANKAVLGTYLSGYLKDSDFLTGTVNDPYVTKNLHDIMQKGMELANTKGMTTTMLYSALSPEVSSLSQSVQGIKELERQRKDTEAIIKANKGIDAEKFNSEFRKNAYYNPDGTLKNKEGLAKIDYTKDWGDYTLKNSNIYNTEGIDELVQKSGKNTTQLQTKVVDPNRGARSASLEITSPEFMIPKQDEKGVFQGFEPRHDFATVNGVRQQQPVLDAEGRQVMQNGKPVTEDVKIVQPDDWNMLINDKRAAPYILQEVRKYASQKGISPASPEAEIYGKQLGYQLLNQSSKDYSTHKETSVQKAAPINISVGGQGKGGAADANINDMYTRLYKQADNVINVKGRPYMQANMMPPDIMTVVLKQAKDAKGNSDLSNADIYLAFDENKNLGIYGKDDNVLITEVTPQGINVVATPGIKGKQKAIKKGEPALVTTKKNQSYSVLATGKKYTYADLKALKYTDADIQQAIKNGKIK